MARILLGVTGSIAAYKAAGPQPGLSFGSGYQMKESAANLMVAVRK